MAEPGRNLENSGEVGTQGGKGKSRRRRNTIIWGVVVSR